MDRGPRISGRLAPLPATGGESRSGEASHGVFYSPGPDAHFPSLPGKLGGGTHSISSALGATWRNGPGALRRDFLPGKKTEPHEGILPWHTVGGQDSGAVAAGLQPRGDTYEDKNKTKKQVH